MSEEKPYTHMRVLPKHDGSKLSPADIVLVATEAVDSKLSPGQVCIIVACDKDSTFWNVSGISPFAVPDLLRGLADRYEVRLAQSTTKA